MLSGLLKTDGYANCQGFAARCIEVLKYYTALINICNYYVPHTEETLMRTLFSGYFLGTI